MLDRDGVINRDRPDYVKTAAEFVLYPETAAAIFRLVQNHIAVAVVSNQSGLNRGIIDWDDFIEIHLKMIRSIRSQGGEIGASLYCPHHPDTGCECRKPKPAMLLEAIRLFAVDMASAVMIGDRATDIEAAARAGCRSILLQREEENVSDVRPVELAAGFSCCADLEEAVERAMGFLDAPIPATDNA